MKFKRPGLDSEYSSRPKKLKEVCGRFEELSLQFGIEPTVTRVLEAIPGATGVHPDGRAVDFRDELVYYDSNNAQHTRYIYTDSQVDQIVNALNSEYPRADGKLVCKHHSFQGAPFHFHVQIPMEWVEKGELDA